jgi:hypothetical protein
LTGLSASGSIGGVKWLLLGALVLLQCSCTTLVNRRDLYSPEPSPYAMPPVSKTTTTTTTIKTQTEETAPAPAYR